MQVGYPCDRRGLLFARRKANMASYPLPTRDGSNIHTGENYRAFGNDVYGLHQNLKRLEGTIKKAQTSLLAFGAAKNEILIEDQLSFQDIIGDYKHTLDRCHELIEDNLRYAQTTTGPLSNIEWHINVMPQVEHLRGRIQMHNSRIQHLLKPFEM